MHVASDLHLLAPDHHVSFCRRYRRLLWARTLPPPTPLHTLHGHVTEYYNNVLKLLEALQSSCLWPSPIFAAHVSCIFVSGEDIYYMPGQAGRHKDLDVAVSQPLSTILPSVQQHKEEHL